jgi:hypothetical protein
MRCPVNGQCFIPWRLLHSWWVAFRRFAAYSNERLVLEGGPISNIENCYYLIRPLKRYAHRRLVTSSAPIMDFVTAVILSMALYPQTAFPASLRTAPQPPKRPM